MIHVLGNDPKKVELKDIRDCVYYKQQKIFSETQYNRSRDLKKAINKGSLTVLKRTSEKDGDFDIPDTDVHTSIPNPTINISPDKRLEELNSRIKNIEEAVKKGNSIDSSQITGLVEKVNNLEGSILGNNSNEGIVATLLSVIKNLEEKIEKNEKSNDVLDKLDKLLSRDPVTVVQRGQVTKEPVSTRPEEVYVPSVSVEDANQHIKLDVRKIEKGNKVKDALQKLKELKSKSK